MEDRQAFRDERAGRLDHRAAEIDRLEAGAAGAGAHARREQESRIEPLRKKQRRAREKLDELEGAEGEALEEPKVAIRELWDDLGAMVQRASDETG